MSWTVFWRIVRQPGSPSRRARGGRAMRWTVFGRIVRRPGSPSRRARGGPTMTDGTGSEWFGEMQRKGKEAEGIRLAEPVTAVPGVGPARAAGLAAAGVETVEDLLHHLPFRYEDRSRATPVAELVAGRRSAVFVEVERCRLVRRGRDSRVEARVGDASGSIGVVWFRQPYIHGALGAGDRVWLYGNVGSHADELQLVNPVFEVVHRAPAAAEAGADAGSSGAAAPGSLAPAAGLHVGRLVPIYRRIGKLTPGVLRRLIDAALTSLDDPAETLPAASRRRLGLIDRGRALRDVHRPPAGAGVDAYNASASPAHRRLIVEELIDFQLGLQMQRETVVGAPRRWPAPGAAQAAAKALRGLPFELTAGQRRALQTILAEMSGDGPMHRLVQGDVGCGKTVVVGCAMLAMAAAGGQAALMVPTEILARQHAASLGGWAATQGFAVECLTGGQPAAARQAVRDGLAAGDVRLVVGTHALIEPDVTFSRLGLAVVDEQHRFGVRQRAALRAKGAGDDGGLPDLLVMTATPIPRSLALTVYGDLDLCTIEDMPPGRQPVESIVVAARRWPEVVEALLRTAGRGEQAYVVAPRIEAGDDDLAAATRLEADLSRQLTGVRVGLVHGAQGSDERFAAMQAFVDGTIQVLAATTVIEVGVDVANATLMVVGHAERFGLSQLHQLRGRVGRGSAPSTCIFLAHPPLTAAAKARLEAVRATGSGFVLAEKDLELRGPGEVLGTRQAGLAGLRVGDPFRDHALLAGAREEAARLLVADDAEAAACRRHATRRWDRRADAAGAG